MPWTVSDPPPPAKNWAMADKQKCVKAANSVLKDGGTEEDAIFACISAAGRQDSKTTVKTTLDGLKTIRKAIQFAQQTDDGFDVEIFSVGTWNGMKFSVEDLDDFASNFEALKGVNDVPIKAGHNPEQPLTDGQPAMGWVDKIRVVGEKLVATVTNVPEIVKKAIKKKLYRNVSIEALFDVVYKGKTYRNVLDAVAFLGVDPPAVNNLADLDAFMSRSSLEFDRQASFSAITGKNIQTEEVSNMDIEEMKAENDRLKAENIAKTKQVETLVKDKAEFERSNAQLKAELDAKNEVDKHGKFIQFREEMTTKLNTMVEEGKITPATRDSYLKELNEEDELSVDKVKFGVESLEKAIEANPKFYGNEAARARKKREADEENEAPDQIVVERAHKYMADHGEKSFTVAKNAVLQADKKLAERYVRMNQAGGA